MSCLPLKGEGKKNTVRKKYTQGLKNKITRVIFEFQLFIK